MKQRQIVFKLKNKFSLKMPENLVSVTPLQRILLYFEARR